jgi:hypothetical protein
MVSFPMLMCCMVADSIARPQDGKVSHVVVSS